ncbi:MAG: flagellar hook-associated protein FlgK [Gaiellales bacterium]
MYKSTFMGLNTALRGVLAHQNALDVTGHNISNLNTAGYTRQRAEMVTAPAWSNPSAFSQVTPGQMGTGVEVLRIERLRDQFIDVNVRQQFGRQAYAQTLVEQLSQVEAAFQEPGENGVARLMNNFWSAMDAVASNPQDPGARQAFVAAADALATGFRQVSADLQNIADQSNRRLDATVNEVNDISQRIASLNGEIRNAVEHRHQPNDLLDERDRLMDQLSKLINFTSTEAANGEVSITFGTTTPIGLVDPLVAGGSTPITRAELDSAFANGDLRSGRAFADESLWDPTTGIIPAYMAQLDQLVASFVVGVNVAHAGGTDIAGGAGGDLFTATGMTAASITVDAAILGDYRLVAASSSAPGPAEPGNGGNFASMLDTLRNAAQGAPLNGSWEGFYTSIVTGTGARAQTAQRALSNSDILVSMAVGRREQVSGVSLDEEMSNMLRFQHAYNASARVMTTMDDALDTIINRMGRVGL